MWRVNSPFYPTAERKNTHKQTRKEILAIRSRSCDIFNGLPPVFLLTALYFDFEKHYFFDLRCPQ